MAKFNASTAVEALEYDFTKYGGGAGIIPEPTNDQVSTFFAALSKAYKDVTSVFSTEEPLPSEEAPKRLADLSDEEVEEMSGSLVKAISDLCSNQPSIEDLKRLPYRVLGAFTGWIAGAISPEAQTPGSRA